MRNVAALFSVLLMALAWSACSSPTGSGGSFASPPTKPSAPGGQSTGANTFYVRPDGGSAEQCTGLADAPYPGSGSGQPCAWDHPFRALPPGGAPRIAGGDTLLIAAGSYRMGYGAPGADDCEADYPWECTMPPLPSGPDAAHPTRLLGAGWDAGCALPPELWGAERAGQILNLAGSSHVEVACLEITDHSGCVEFHADPALACPRDAYPYGDWAAAGLYAADAADVTLRHLDIHGLASAGVRAGRLTDWVVEDVRLAANGWIGWEGDIDGGDANAGTLRFRRWTVEWNGCAETYPAQQPAGCWDENVGGYGDGVGTGATGGDWLIEDSAFLHNTSDGLDLLYHSQGGRVVLDRVRAEGNAGNQVKIAGQAAITNSLLVGNCAFFDGQPFTYHVEPCRALGNALEFAYTGGEQVTLVNSTLYGQGDGLVGAGPREAGQCDGSETLTAWNNVFLGDADYFDPGDVTFLFYQEGCADLALDSDYNVVHRAKNIDCGASSGYVSSGAHDLCQDPLLTGPLAGMKYGLTLSPDSPAIDAGTAQGAPTVDFQGLPRDTAPDMGAYEWRAAAACDGAAGKCETAVPVVLNNWSQAPADWWRPPVGATWQWQLTGLPIDSSYDADVYDVDLFDNEAAAVAALHAQGRKAICYLSAGSWEDWRPDADQFPAAVLGNDYEGWPGEKWLDIRQIDLLAPIMRGRLDQCRAKGFDGVEPDNIDGYTNDTGFPLTYQDQLDYNRWLAAEAHARGLSIGLKNDDEQVAALLADFDWALTEDCFAQDWCQAMAPFIAAGKAVFAAEYSDEWTVEQFLAQVCPQAAALHFSAILKDRDLDAWRRGCP